MGEKMNIDFYGAGKDCVLIFTGLGGEIKGFENKYVKTAELITKEYGYSVFVAGVPEDCWSRPQEVFVTAAEYVINKLNPGKMCVFGNSAGASLAIWYSHLYPVIKKVLAVNPVLNLNYHRTKEGVENFSGEKMLIKVGELDPCAVWLNALPQKENLHKEILKGVDHTFTGRIDEFISLPVKTLFG